MKLENKIAKLHELISLSLSKGQQNYAISLINDIIEEYNVLERVIDIKKSTKINIDYDKYEYFSEKCVDVLIAIGFNYTDIFEVDKEALDFIKYHRYKFKKPLTAEYLLTLVRLYKFHTEWFGNKPNNLKDLHNAYCEIEGLRKEQL